MRRKTSNSPSSRSPRSTLSLLLLFLLVVLLEATNPILDDPSNNPNNKHTIRITSMDNNNVDSLQSPKDYPSQKSNGKRSSSNVSMLELSTRPWLYHLSQKYNSNITTLADIPDAELQAIAAQNYDYVWFMGVWHLGPYGLHYDRTDPGLLQSYSQVLPGYTMDDIIGSPYAVTNYTINPQLGASDNDLLKFKLRLNRLGLKLMLDFVPNHSAVDCDWTSTQPDYYIHAPKGTQPPYDPNHYLPNGIAYGSSCSGCGSWPDTAQFNYWNSELGKARLQELLHVASVSDGIRCDMAYLLLNDVFQQTWGQELSSWGWKRPSNEWWATAISAVKSQYPDVIFLAEVYSPWESPLQSVGFDYTYDKLLYDKLGNGNLDDIRNWLSSNSVEYISRSAHFVANHDEPRAASYFGSWWRADAAALLSYTLPGMRFYWMWDNLGYKNKLDVHLRREKSESAVSDVTTLYNSLISITNTDVFNKGTWTYLTVSGSESWRLIAYRWEYNNEKRLCVINYSDQSGSGSVIVSNAQPGKNGNDTIPVTDLLSNQTYYRSASDMRTKGLSVVINSWYAQIFKY